MNQKQIDKLLSLIRRTGDRAIIADNNSDGLFVVMDSTDYERFLGHSKSVKGLSEQEMMDRINRDISLWHSQNDIQDTHREINVVSNHQDLETTEDFLDTYWDADTVDTMVDEPNEEIADLGLEDKDNEEIPFEELERDGFVVTGEDAELDEPIYLEKVGDEPLPVNNSEHIDEIQIKDDVDESGDKNMLNKVNNVFEEALDDVIEDNEGAQFLDEPIE